MNNKRYVKKRVLNSRFYFVLFLFVIFLFVFTYLLNFDTVKGFDEKLSVNKFDNLYLLDCNDFITNNSESDKYIVYKLFSNGMNLNSFIINLNFIF